MNAQSIVTSGTGLYKAVCHKCHYVGFEPNSSTCPYCSFPIILEPYEKTTREALLEIFDRNSVHVSVEHNAPRLPGVSSDDGTSAARRQRARSHGTQVKSVTVLPAPDDRAPEPVTAEPPRPARFRRLRAALGLVSISLGAVIAAASHGL